MRWLPLRNNFWRNSSIVVVIFLLIAAAVVFIKTENISEQPSGPAEKSISQEQGSSAEKQSSAEQSNSAEKKEISVEDFYVGMGDWKAALRQYALWLESQKKYLLAIEKFDELLEKYPDDKELVLEALDYKVRIFMKTKSYDKAIRTVQISFTV